MKISRAFSLVIASSLLACWPVLASAADAPKATDAKPASTTATNADVAASFQAGNYKLRPTEVISVKVVDDDRASGSFRIGIDGNVQLPYIQDHPVKVAGLSASQAADLIAKAYVDQQIFVKPSVNVSVTEFVPEEVYFLGEVNKQGSIPIPAGQTLTLTQALAAANGPTHNAAATVTITRINTDGTTSVLKDVDLLGATKDKKKDIALQEGDTITLGQSLLGNVWQ